MNCSRPNCPGRAVWRPLLEMRTSVKSPPRKATFTELNLCEQHKDQVRLTDFISGSSWDRIVRHIKQSGLPVPKRLLTTLQYELVDSPESTDEEKLAF